MQSQLAKEGHALNDIYLVASGPGNGVACVSEDESSTMMMTPMIDQRELGAAVVDAGWVEDQTNLNLNSMRTTGHPITQARRDGP